MIKNIYKIFKHKKPCRKNKQSEKSPLASNIEVQRSQDTENKQNNTGSDLKSAKTLRKS